jgi:hypothetical protein
VVAWALVRRAQQLDDRDQFATQTVQNLQAREAFDIRFRQQDMGGSLQDTGGRGTRRHRGALAAGYREIRPSQRSALRRRNVVKIEVFVDQHDVLGPDQVDQGRGSRRHEALVKVVPDDLLFQVRVQTRKGRWHRAILRTRGIPACSPSAI